MTTPRGALERVLEKLRPRAEARDETVLMSLARLETMAQLVGDTETFREARRLRQGLVEFIETKRELC